jgi:desulfoferrodoxin (superoxide reductase-like protein)
MAGGMTRRCFVSFVGSATGAAALGSWLPGCMAPVGVGVEDDGRNAQWEARAAALEGAKVYDKTTQWMGEDKAATHVPQVTVSAGTVLVLVPHPMTAEHYITDVYLRDQDGAVVAFHSFPQPAEGSDLTGADPGPFELDASITEVTVYAHCNQHNTWKADPVAMDG